MGKYFKEINSETKEYFKILSNAYSKYVFN